MRSRHDRRAAGTERLEIAMRLLRLLYPWFAFDNPAFRWGFTHPLGPPAPWWSQERREQWYQQNGVPWER
ncbi:hypothetical protein D2E40_17165 [Mycobacteroides abscessus]|nr:hypothetical protein DDJ92_21255 [Mycobacteroides abscessus]RIQ99294.1 hypothetical protein D2E40_17165 [Mycobacteroides abscessus]